MAGELRAHDLVVRRTDRGLVVYVPDVLFEFDSIELTPPARLRVAAAGGIIERLGGARAISVEGHADSTGDPGYNLSLSLDRARTVHRELIAGGLAAARLKVRGYGEAYPISTNRSREGRRLNRRVEIVIQR